jgi:hypothetical protein
MPIFPLIFREKAMALRYGGNLEAAYRGRKTVFTPSLAQHAAASALETVVRVSDSMDRRFEQLQGPTQQPSAQASADCPHPWGFFCQAVADSVGYALSQGKRAVVVTPPYLSEAHREQQAAMAAMLRQRFGGDARVRHVDLGQGVVDLTDAALCYDGMHLTAEGNARVAEALAHPVLEALRPDA